MSTARLRIEPHDTHAADDTGVANGVGSATCLALHGELDFATSADLDHELERLDSHGLISNQNPNLVLDMTGLAFCDSAGLAVLIAAYQRLARLGGTVTLRGMRGPLRRVVSIAGLDSLFRIDPAEG
ncbi:MAG TPA: STAS domain-containing protein [Pseudonocardia sp.]|jgi:anti-sigma B factor antagonist